MELQKRVRIYELGSLPPFLLVFAGVIVPVNHRWNQHGLGGDNFRGWWRSICESSSASADDSSVGSSEVTADAEKLRRRRRKVVVARARSLFIFQGVVSRFWVWVN
ncbi:unnamed protein product [Linum tenue]|uniref:Uncharacterized protein n=1 Tax=Linum tenue TaxID=586396 RepID=A0AAV0L920_9ROSI|nr:unnamed protein product [Linum tenue]